jgi:hypothetical protein
MLTQARWATLSWVTRSPLAAKMTQAPWPMGHETDLGGWGCTAVADANKRGSEEGQPMSLKIQKKLAKTTSLSR